MKQDKDWIDVMRSTLRDAETPPPADGWARLERELGTIPAPRIPAWRIHWPRIAAAAAAVVICIGAGEYLWTADQDLNGFDGNVIAEVDGGGSAVDQGLLKEMGETSAATLAMAAPAPAVAVKATVPPMKSAAVPNRVAEQLVAEIPVIHAAVESQAETKDTAVAEPANKASEKNSEGAAPATRAAVQSARQPSVQTSRGNLYNNDFVAYAPPRKKTSFSLYGGGGVTGGSHSGVSTRMQSNAPAGAIDGGSISLMKQYDYARGSFRHHQPLSFGLSVRKEFAHGLSLESGVNYTLLHSDVNLFSGSKNIDQKLHFIGVPLRMNWQFLERGRFSLYIGAGGMVEKCLSARFDGKTSEEPKVQWSALGAVGAQYRLGGTVGLFFEPEMSYYFTETQLRTVRTDSPLTLTLRMGVRLSF